MLIEKKFKRLSIISPFVMPIARTKNAIEYLKLNYKMLFVRNYFLKNPHTIFPIANDLWAHKLQISIEALWDLIFDYSYKTSNLEYFKTITNVESGHIAYSDDYHSIPRPSKKKNKNAKDAKEAEKTEKKVEKKQNKCVIAYQDFTNKKNIVLSEFLFDKDNTKILGVKTRNIEIEFNSNGLKYVGLVSSYLIVSSAVGNKVHMYDIETGKFKYCLFLGNFPYEISGLDLDVKQKILSIVTNNKYLKLYKLNKLSKQCKCYSHNDEKVSMNEERGVFDKFKHKLGMGRNDFLCRYKVNMTVFDMKDNITQVFFDKSCNDMIFIIQSNKNVKELKI
jgi:hypothetical protein